MNDTMIASTGRKPQPSGTSPPAALALGALGVVFGDIGTSPLYALKACFAPEYGLGMTADNVTGLVSLIVWTLTIVVSVKYVVFIMQADNHGEGGIFALLALILPRSRRDSPTRGTAVLTVLGLVGAALLYGDGVITPAISVLSAVEGVHIALPSLENVVVPASAIILLLLFAVQRFGTGRIGRVAGPLMLVWFLAIGALGAAAVVRRPAIIAALSPIAGARFLAAHGVHALVVLGAVVLAVTGAEALYADMGHFGTRPIRTAWFAVVFPTLVLNYLGQGALLLGDAAAVRNPFYLLAPAWLSLPLVALATLATIIASQALISGAFSLTQQAMQLGYAPRIRILHTSAETEGQIYAPAVNAGLMVACLLLVLAFRSSDRLAAAYGIAVTGTMAVTTMLFYAVARSRWGWSRIGAGAPAAVFLIVDLTFFGSNLLKIVQGGWVPISIGAAVYLLLSTWRSGHERLMAIHGDAALPLEAVYRTIDEAGVARVSGAGVFFTAHPDRAPSTLIRLLRDVKALHDVVVLLGVSTVDDPVVPKDQRLSLERFSDGFVGVTARFGFTETPTADEMVAALRAEGVLTDASPVYFASRDHVRVGANGGMAQWRKRLFALMVRNTGTATDFFHVPADAAIEIGGAVDL